MQKYSKRFLSLFLAIILLLSLCPLSAFAVGEDCTVYVTVSDEGALATDKTDRIVAQAPVTLSGKESYTIDDAFYALHEDCYDGGAAVGYATSTGAYGLSLDKFWGKTTGTCFYVNNVSANGLADAVSDGDHITAYILKDTVGWSDLYAYFNTDTLYAETGAAKSLTLCSDCWGTPGVISGAQLCTVDADGTAAAIPGAVTDENGQADVCFDMAGTYFISAQSGGPVISAPVCRVTVADPAEPHVTVRIEGNGLGTDGMDPAVGTVLPNTVVNLSGPDATITALEAVNDALSSNGLPPAAGSGGFYTSFGGVSGTGGASWMFLLDDAYVGAGLDGTTVSNGEDIVLALADYSMDTGTYTTGYSYFKIAGRSSSVKWGYAYGEVTLALYEMTNSGWGGAPDYSPLWNVSVVPDTAVYVGKTQAYTPDSALAVTDAENGTATVTLWGGDAAGTYYFDVSANTAGATRAYCRAKMVYDGVNPPVLTFSQPSAADTGLAALSLTFPGAAAMNGLPYLSTDGMTVDNAVESVSAAPTASAPEAAVAAAYQAAGAEAPCAYTPGDSAALAVGDNVFKFTVTNGTDRQVHTLIVTRADAAARNIPAEVAAVINGVKTVTGDAPYSDWVLAMHAAGFTVSDAQLQPYLAAVLASVNAFADSGAGFVGTMAKHAIALTSLGIDARQIPDPDGGEAIDLIARIASYPGTVDPVYAAPYILSLYDLGNYEIPDGAAITRAGLIADILGSQDGTTKLWAGADGTGMVLPALAPYYKADSAVNGIDIATCDAVTEAVDSALAALSDTQAIDGGMGTRNSNTTSTVITGLAAVGVNPHTDVRFVKSGSSLLTDLLSFRTADDKLGYTGNAAVNTMACYQGFQALATYQNLESGARNRNLYHFTAEIAPYTAWPDARLLTGITVTAPPAVTTYAYSETDTACAPDTDGMAVTATYNADASDTAVIPVADCTLSVIDRSSPGTKTVTVTYQGKTATFMVTVLNSDSTVPVQKTVSVSVRSSSGRIASGTAVIEEGSTSALDVLKTVLAEAGKTYVIRNGTYVASIDGLGEFDEGPNSGWLYAVNGVTPPATAAADYLLMDGDAVLWYYTLDYTRDSSSGSWVDMTVPSGTVAPEVTVNGGTASAAVTASELEDAAEAARESGEAVVTIAPAVTGDVSGVSVTVPGPALQSLAADTAMAVILNTPAGSVELGSGALGSIAEQAGGGEIEFTVASRTAADVDLPEEDLENCMIVSVSITSGGQSITRFGGNSLKLSLPVNSGYTVGERYKVIVISAGGSVETLWGTAVCTDGATFVEVTAEHLSTFVVTGGRAGAFADVARGAWYEDAVKFAVVNGLFRGTSGDRFSPDADMSRAMLATVLYRMADSPAVNAGNSFSDVENGTWYTDAVVWASANGIVRGIGGGLYGTNLPVTRQETAVMLCRFAAWQGYNVTSTADLSVYGDADGIADWASDAMAWANAEGMITGVTGTSLAPDRSSSRATVAVILMRFEEKTAG